MHSKLAKFVASVSMFVKGEDKLVAVRQTNQYDNKNKNAPNTSALHSENNSRARGPDAP